MSIGNRGGGVSSGFWAGDKSKGIPGEWDWMKGRSSRMPSRRYAKRGTGTHGDWGQRSQNRGNSRSRSRTSAGFGPGEWDFLKRLNAGGGMGRPGTGLAGGRSRPRGGMGRLSDRFDKRRGSNPGGFGQATFGQTSRNPMYGRGMGRPSAGWSPGRVIDKYSRWGGPNQRPDGKQTIPNYQPVEQGRRWDARGGRGSRPSTGLRGGREANSRTGGTYFRGGGRSRRMSNARNLRNRRGVRGRRNTGRIVPRRGGGFISQYGGGGANRGRVIPGRRRVMR